jgi:methylmalonyl-CoA mutase cobalamin-binding domain/chain
MGSVEKPIRVLLAKVGLDGHDRGVKVVARALRDGGMEVIYTGLHRRPEEVVAAAIHEDVDVIGLSILSGAHMTIFPRLVALMKRDGVFGEISLVAGGVIPDEDVAALRDLGVDAIVDQEATAAEVVGAVRRLVEAKRAAGAR